jgi:hypothetical protein
MSTIVLGLTATAEIEVDHTFVSEELELERQAALDEKESK